jgi:hypothetical protein
MLTQTHTTIIPIWYVILSHAQIKSVFCNCAVSECGEPASKITENEWYGAEHDEEKLLEAGRAQNEFVVLPLATCDLPCSSHLKRYRTRLKGSFKRLSAVNNRMSVSRLFRLAANLTHLEAARETSRQESLRPCVSPRKR